MIVDSHFPVAIPATCTHALSYDEAIRLLDGFLETFANERVEIFLFDHSIGVLAESSNAALSFRRDTREGPAFLWHLRGHLKNAIPSTTSNRNLLITPRANAAILAA